MGRLKIDCMEFMTSVLHKKPSKLSVNEFRHVDECCVCIFLVWSVTWSFATAGLSTAMNVDVKCTRSVCYIWNISGLQASSVSRVEHALGTSARITNILQNVRHVFQVL
jgi:hypothetical protein